MIPVVRHDAAKSSLSAFEIGSREHPVRRDVGVDDRPHALLRDGAGVVGRGPSARRGPAFRGNDAVFCIDPNGNFFRAKLIDNGADKRQRLARARPNDDAIDTFASSASAIAFSERIPPPSSMKSGLALATARTRLRFFNSPVNAPSRSTMWRYRAPAA